MDLDYYANMGAMAYSSLANSVRESLAARLYSEMATKFVAFADVLTLISQKYLHTETSENLLTLFEKYIKTGSSLAKDELLERGVIPSSSKGSYSNDH